MVTTIKITCDGVCIQSNPFLSAALTSSATIEQDISNGNLLDFNDIGIATITPTTTKTISTSRREKESQLISSTNNTRRSYYFGNNNIYWCKESLSALNTTHKNVKKANPNTTTRRGSNGISRSASCLTHKESQKGGYQSNVSGVDNSKRYRKQHSASLCAATIQTNRAKSSKEFHFIEKNTKCPKIAGLKLTNSYIGIAGNDASLALSHDNNKNYNTNDRRLFSFLRSARKLYRNSNGDIVATGKHVENATSTQDTKCPNNVDYYMKKRLSLTALNGSPITPFKKDTILKLFDSTLNKDAVRIGDDWFDEESLKTREEERQSNINNKNTIIQASGKPIKSGAAWATAAISKSSLATDMSSHATVTQALHNLQSSGQTSVVGHHRGFSQPSVTVAANSAGDPWFLQSTGHQMPPTAPLRHNKRPAPQPTGIGGVGGVSVSSTAAITGGLLHQQQQLSQSQPHIVPPSIPPHQNSVNPHINAIHLSSHALNSHNIIASNHSPKSPNQQQQQQLTATSSVTVAALPQQQHHPHSHIHGVLNSHPHVATNVAAAAVAAATQQQQQQHLQLLANTSNNNANNNNNLMSSSLNAAQLQGHMSVAVGGPIGGSAVVPITLGLDRALPPKTGGLHSSNMLLHTSVTQQQQQQHLLSQQPSSLSTTLSAPQSLSSSGMSTSLHSFDVNGGASAWSTAPATSLSPTTSLAPNHGSGISGVMLQQPQRKCEVKLNAMPWFHGSITRDEAEHLLQPREDGLFLVRESTNFPGDYTLCVCFQGKVEHYRVKYLENKLTIDDEEYFENLGQLVAHYEADADGLCTQLINCLPKKGKQEFCINSKDFVDKGWVIPETDLQLRESIGKGEFGDVMLGILRNEKVAVKMLKDEGAVQKFLAEASVMTTLEHENLVKFIGLVFTSKHIYLVTEFMSKGSLVDYLRSRGRQHITKKDQINFAYDTASGMEYLEAKKVVHRDLAARNVLISETCVAKVSDFGLAREECYNLDVGKLPIKWTAPEALKNGRFSNKSDMWSFGILLWEIYSFGRVPYPRIPLADVVKHVEVGYKMEAPEGCPPEIYEMMRQAWDLNPTKRPTFSELKVKLLHLKNLTA